MERNWKRNLLVLSAAQFVSMIGMSFFLPFIPLYLRELNVRSDHDVAVWSGVLYSAAFFVLSFVAPVWGALADRWGRKVMVVRAMGTGAVILFMTGFVTTPGQLLTLRLIHGALAGFVSSAIALISTETPEDSLGYGLGFFQSCLTAGIIVGPFLGGFLHDFFGVRATIKIGAALLLVAASLVFFWVKERTDVPRSSAPTRVLDNMKFLWGNENLKKAAQIQFLSNFGLISVQPLLTIFVQRLAGVEGAVVGRLSGAVFAASAFSMMISAPLWGRLSDRWGQKKVLTLSLFLSSLCFIPQAFSQNVFQLISSRLLTGFFIGGISPSVQSFTSQMAPLERRAGILGVSFSLTMLGNAFGAMAGGYLVAMGGIRLPFVGVFVLLLATSFFSRRLNLERAVTNRPLLAPID